MTRAKRGRLIVLEGPDGVGKTTLSHLVADDLRSRGRSAVAMSFPGRSDGSLGQLVYRLHHDPPSLGVSQLSEQALQTMHVAAHLDAIQTRILPALEAGTDVILDRFWWSTVVYGKVGGLDAGFLRRLIAVEKASWGRTIPDAAIVLTRPSPMDRDVDEQHWQSLMAAYEDLAAAENGRLIPNVGTPADAVADILSPFSSVQGLRPGQGSFDLKVEDERDRFPTAHSQLSPARPTRVFDTYWRFAAERQEIFFRRLRHEPEPWTADPILRRGWSSRRAEMRTVDFVDRYTRAAKSCPRRRPVRTAVL